MTDLGLEGSGLLLWRSATRLGGDWGRLLDF